MSSNLKEYKCPNCGGAVEWDASTQKMKCPFCDAEFEQEVLEQYVNKISNVLEDDMNWQNTQTEWDSDNDGFISYVCKSCGGEIIADSTTGATTCPYCGNNVTMKGTFAGDLKPDYILPFKQSKQNAIDALKQHFSKKFFLPKAFKNDHHLEEIKGVYVPFWLFSASANVDARYKATTSRSWSDSKYRYTETKYYAAFRSGSTAFKQVPVDGSSKMPDDMMESIEPFDYSELKAFATTYMAGFIADRYDVTSDTSKTRANDRIKKSSEDIFKQTVTGYQTVVTEHVSVQLSDNKVEYALLPVWLLTTKWKDKNYLFAMNGQTGKFIGDLPIDGAKAAKTFFGLSGLFYALLFIGQYLLWAWG